MSEDKRRINVNKLPKKYKQLEKPIKYKISDTLENQNPPADDYYLEQSDKNIKRTVGIIGFICCIGALCAIVLFAIVPMYIQPDAVHTNMSGGDKKFSLFMAPNSQQQKAAVNLKKILPQMRSLYESNSDIAGWVKIDGTVIDYPVMYTPWDGEYYLYRTFEKEQDATKQGCLFIDPLNSLTPRDMNLVIYGHNMKNGTMFNTLLKYQDEEYFKEHPSIEFNTLYDEGTYDIISVFKSKVYNQDEYNVFKFYRFYNAYSKEMFDDFLKNINELQLYDTGKTAEYGDQLLTLATCDRSVKNGRFVVVAKKRV